MTRKRKALGNRESPQVLLDVAVNCRPAPPPCPPLTWTDGRAGECVLPNEALA